MCVHGSQKTAVGANLLVSMAGIVAQTLGVHIPAPSEPQPSAPREGLHTWAGIYSLSPSRAIVSQTNTNVNFAQALTETSCTNSATWSGM